jgi:hypothetical protein
MSKETKFGYGFLLVGVGVPYLIDKLIGPIFALLVAVVCTIIGVALLRAGHTHRDREGLGFSLPDKRTGEKTMTAVIIVVVAASLIWGVVRVVTREAKTDTPSPTITPVTHHIESTVTMTEWGAERGNKVYAVVKIESPPPANAPFQMMFISRVQDSSRDEMEDTTIEKSDLRPLTGQTIELNVTQDFLRRAVQWKFVRAILVLLPASVQSNQISKLSDVPKLGGQIAINNSFVMPVTQQRSYKGSRHLEVDVGASRETKYAFAKLDTAVLEPWRKDFNVMLILRVADRSVETLHDKLINKSDAFAITGEVRTLGVNLTPDFINKADQMSGRFRDMTIEYHVVVVPKTVSPDQITMLSDLDVVGGKKIQEYEELKRLPK